MQMPSLDVRTLNASLSGGPVNFSPDRGATGGAGEVEVGPAGSVEGPEWDALGIKKFQTDFDWGKGMEMKARPEVG